MKSNLLKTVTKLYQDNLWQCPEALNYLTKDRGLSEEIIKEHELGYAMGQIVSTTFTGDTLQEAIDLGVIDKNRLDFFEGYITFPVVNNGGYTNLYGRTMVDKLVPHKTLPNLPKSGLYNSKALLRPGVVIVESPIDCLTLVQNKLNSCAVMGVKLPDDAIAKFTGVACYILFDRDPSGNLGAVNVASKIFHVASKVAIITFPGKSASKMDTNLFFATGKNPVERIQFLIKNSVPLKTAPFALRQEKTKKNLRNCAEDKVPIAGVGRVLFQNEHFVDKGDELWVRCPHHKEGKERNRSLWVGGKKNIWYCFGCQKGGGPIYLVSWHLKISIEEARAWIAEKIF